MPEPVREVRLRVNGESRTVVCRGDTPLLYLLRNDLGLRGSRFGCGLAQCGACMVLLDGRAVPSCDLPAWAAEDHEVETVEGLAPDPVMSALQQAFLRRQAAQCGFCTSGILVSACAHLRAGAATDPVSTAEALERNLCRCGSHGRVLAAVADAAEALQAARRAECGADGPPVTAPRADGPRGAR
ncbi:2Fe-2S iron-sulfur cluster-binding protein [Geodermatophilus sp. YIM 151500]|uniref:(2Fe-2S)-binding protein n=1 Tax=Geodermatophilus sp. YIM 151500 TaxID=2984531 RepID=UPI0021E41A73|nr:2Fe-2S iron-sulfur cluster-binding protein [Geodermatophilus sp. YIM 151500]MCV2488861.1 2Fe-2S iron-sulfur cluster-binding protein [Geodermatophilus sp. YIM 151500]